MKVAIIGANGKVGRRLGKILADKDYEPVGFIRNEEQVETQQSFGVETQIADIIETTTEEYVQLFKGMDAVVFTAGAGGKGIHLTEAIDGDGAEKIIRAAEIAGVERFLMVSAIPDAGRSTETNEGFELYMQMKRRADVTLVKSSLNWTILRPGTLTDEVGNGNITLGQAIEYGDVSRDHVAEVLAELLVHVDTGKLILELTDGETPIEEAVDYIKRPLR